MKSIRHSRLFHTFISLGAAILMLASNSNPPNGRTGAPFDGSCTNCHTGGSFGGTVEVTGLPGTIQANTVYPLSVTLTPTSGSPTKGGYQLVVVDNANVDCGDLTTVNSQSGTETFGSREYIDHRGGKAFNGNPITWDFNWTSPATVNGNTVKFYFIGNFTNGNNSNLGDNAFSVLETVPFAGPPPLAASINTTTDVSCFGGSNGSATVEATGGIPPYSYLWSNGQTTQTAINLAAGNYSVTVTGSGGSGTATASTTITQPPQIALTATVSNTLNCIQSEATITASASGGVGGFSFAWSNGAVGNPIQVDAIGTYTVTATDGNGCTKTATATVQGNTTPPTATVAPPGSITCTQSIVTLNGVGSSTGPGFTYLWTTTNGNIVCCATTLNPQVNASGTYTLVVTNSTNGCTASASVVVTSNTTPPTATATGGQITCAAPGITINASSNLSSTYLWNGPNGFTSNLQNPTVSAPGIYTVTVTANNNGCTATATATVTANNTPPTLSATGGTITCLNTSVVITTSTNATSPQYAWSGPAALPNVPNPTATVAGAYTVTVTNGANGCTATATAVVGQNNTPPTVSVPSGTLTCTTLGVQVCATTNSSNPAYAWSGPAGSSTQACIMATSPGAYTVIVTDNGNGCTASATATITQNTTPPVASATVPGNLNCNVDTLQINGSASSQGANFSYNWTTPNGHIVSGQNTLTPLIDAAGTYNLLVTNSINGCTATTAVTVNQSPPVTATLGSTTNVSCNGGTNGSATVTAGGGTGGFDIAWSNGDSTATTSGLAAGTYTVTVTDGENCTASVTAVITQPAVLLPNATATGVTGLNTNDGTATSAPTGGTPAYSFIWSNGGTTAVLFNLAPGSYTVTVTDGNGCTAVQTVTVNSFNCNLTTSIVSTNATCSGAANGTASVSVSGATAPVGYAWSNGSTTASVSGLAPGSYSVTVTDGAGCTNVLSATITEPPALLPNATATGETAVNAHDGTASAQPTGGTPAYAYLWSNDSTSATITGLTAGAYTVTVTDLNGCTAVQTVTVNPFGCALSATITSANLLCFNDNTGQATITVAGGASPFTYLWSNGSTMATASGLAAGTYGVTATDAAGCTVVQQAVITQPPALSQQVTVTDVECPDDQDGSASIVVSGGTQPYTISWTGGGGPPSGLGTGTYDFTVTDANGCTLLAQFTVVSTDTLAPALVCPSNLTSCEGMAVEFDFPTASDNCTVDSVMLAGGLPGGSIFPPGATTQLYVATDDSGNSATCSFTVTVTSPPAIALDEVINDLNGAGGSISVTVTGGTAPYQFEWLKDGLFYSDDEDLTGLGAGEYELQVTDANGCVQALPVIKIELILGNQEASSAGLLRILPNPARTSFRLETGGLEPAGAQLFDVRGGLVRILSAEECRQPIDVEPLASGMYYLQVRSQSGKWYGLSLVKEE